MGQYFLQEFTKFFDTFIVVLTNIKYEHANFGVNRNNVKLDRLRFYRGMYA